VRVLQRHRWPVTSLDHPRAKSRATQVFRPWQLARRPANRFAHFFCRPAHIDVDDFRTGHQTLPPRLHRPSCPDRIRRSATTRVGWARHEMSMRAARFRRSCPSNRTSALEHFSRRPVLPPKRAAQNAKGGCGPSRGHGREQDVGRQRVGVHILTPHRLAWRRGARIIGTRKFFYRPPRRHTSISNPFRVLARNPGYPSLRLTRSPGAGEA